MTPSASAATPQAPQTIDTAKNVIHKRKKKHKKPKAPLSAPETKTSPIPSIRSQSQSSRNSNQSIRKHVVEINPSELDLALNKVLESNLTKEARKNKRKEKNKERIDVSKNKKPINSENDQTQKLLSYGTTMPKKIETSSPSIMPSHEKKNVNVENSKMNGKNHTSVNPKKKKSITKKKNTKSSALIPPSQISIEDNEYQETNLCSFGGKVAIHDKIKNDKGKKSNKDKSIRTGNRKGSKHRTKNLNLEPSEGSGSNVSHSSQKIQRTFLSPQNPVPSHVTNKKKILLKQTKPGETTNKDGVDDITTKQEQKQQAGEKEADKFPSNKPRNDNMNDSNDGQPRTRRSRPYLKNKRQPRLKQEKQQSKQDKEFSNPSKNFHSNVHNTDDAIPTSADLNQASNHVTNKKKMKEHDKGKRGTKVQKPKSKKKKSKLGQDKQIKSGTIPDASEDVKKSNTETISTIDPSSIPQGENMPNESDTNCEHKASTKPNGSNALNSIDSLKSPTPLSTSPPFEEKELNSNLQNSVVNSELSHDDVSTYEQFHAEQRFKNYENNQTQLEMFSSQSNNCMISTSDYPNNQSAFGIQVSYPMPYGQNFFRNNQISMYSHLNYIQSQTPVPLVVDDDRNDDAEVVSCDSNQVYDGTTNSFYRTPFYPNEFEMQQPPDGNLPIYPNSVGSSDSMGFGSMQNQNILSNYEYNESRGDINCGGPLPCSNGMGMFSTPQPMVGGGVPVGSFQPYHFGINYAQLQPQPFYPNPQFCISAPGVAGQAFAHNWVESKRSENKESNNAILNVRAPSFEPNSKNSFAKDQ